MFHLFRASYVYKCIHVEISCRLCLNLAKSAQKPRLGNFPQWKLSRAKFPEIFITTLVHCRFVRTSRTRILGIAIGRCKLSPAIQMKRVSSCNRLIIIIDHLYATKLTIQDTSVINNTIGYSSEFYRTQSVSPIRCRRQITSALPAISFMEHAPFPLFQYYRRHFLPTVQTA
jgi:hypothetical protein